MNDIKHHILELVKIIEWSSGRPAMYREPLFLCQSFYKKLFRSCQRGAGCLASSLGICSSAHRQFSDQRGDHIR